MSAGSYNDANNIILADLSDPKQLTAKPRAADGVTVFLRRASGGPRGAAVFSATNSGKVPRNGAWARLDRRFSPCLNLKGREAIGLWIDGDSQGQIIAVRLESPRHISYGAVADRYITVDFNGPRLFTLIETESARWNDYVWNDGKWLYNVYRETINFGYVESLSIWYNNLPKDKQTKCIIGPIKALPMVACDVKNPIVTINGRAIAFPVQMQSGSYLEFNAGSDCVLYGLKGRMIKRVIPAGDIPVLFAGDNQLRFSCELGNGPAPRLKLTVISHGEPL
jgi:hypothetical protein